MSLYAQQTRVLYRMSKIYLYQLIQDAIDSLDSAIADLGTLRTYLNENEQDEHDTDSFTTLIELMEEVKSSLK